jgi:hypothetical protein
MSSSCKAKTSNKFLLDKKPDKFTGHKYFFYWTSWSSLPDKKYWTLINYLLDKKTKITERQIHTQNK